MSQENEQQCHQQLQAKCQSNPALQAHVEKMQAAGLSLSTILAIIAFAEQHKAEIQAAGMELYQLIQQLVAIVHPSPTPVPVK